MGQEVNKEEVLKEIDSLESKIKNEKNPKTLSHYWFEKAEQYKKINEKEKRFECLCKSIEFDPNNIKSLNAKVDELMSEQKYEQAEPHCDHLLKLMKEQKLETFVEKIEFALALIYCNTEQFEKAKFFKERFFSLFKKFKNFEKNTSASFDPNYLDQAFLAFNYMVQGPVLIAKTYLSLGEYEELEEFGEEFIHQLETISEDEKKENLENDKIALRNIAKGLSFLGQKKDKEAYECFQKAIEIDQKQEQRKKEEKEEKEEEKEGQTKKKEKRPTPFSGTLQFCVILLDLLDDTKFGSCIVSLEKMIQKGCINDGESMLFFNAGKFTILQERIDFLKTKVESAATEKKKSQFLYVCGLIFVALSHPDFSFFQKMIEIVGKEDSLVIRMKKVLSTVKTPQVQQYLKKIQ